MDNERTRLRELLAAHEAYRGHTLNLIASENALSPAVRSALASDLVQRYGDYTGRDLSARHYRGNRYLEQIEREAVAIARRVFRAEHVELRPISGHVAGAAVLMGLCRPDDRVLEPGRDGGGHREAGKLATTLLTPLDVRYLPFDPLQYNVDVEKTVRLLDEWHPHVVILGSSNYLFPHPVRAVAEVLHRDPQAVLVYDASHVMGFLAAGCFQDPLREGADLVFGSTHKTLPGPQGGIIFSNRADLMERISQATYPALVTNHHPFRIPALALAILEMEEFGGEYCRQVVANAQALGRALAAQGIPCVQAGGCYSRSHTVLACVAAFGPAATVAARLEEAGIITTAANLPERWGKEGIRFGVQEVTRRGAVEADMETIAGWIAQAAAPSGDPTSIAQETAHFAAGLGPVRYTWDE